MTKELAPRDRLIFALDVSNKQRAWSLIEKLHGHVGAFKVGLELFTAEGRKVLDHADLQNTPVLLDLKLHDIPATVERTCKVLQRYGNPFGVTAHTAGGLEMLRRAAEVLPIYGVTVLTSLSPEDLAGETGTLSVQELVVRRAYRAQRAGCKGVIASPLELGRLRRNLGEDIEIVTPGIRMADAVTPNDDQRRVTTPFNAIAWGATRIVVGRPIRDADDPPAAADAIVSEIELGLKFRKDARFQHMEVGSNMGICGALIDPIANRKQTEPCPECMRISGRRPKLGEGEPSD